MATARKGTGWSVVQQGKAIYMGFSKFKEQNEKRKKSFSNWEVLKRQFLLTSFLYRCIFVLFGDLAGEVPRVVDWAGRKTYI